MSVRGKKTVLRTIRLTQEMDDVLRKGAEQKGESMNGLIESMMTRYIEWDRLATKFGFVTIPSETLRSILEHLDDEEVESIATDLGGSMLKTMTTFWFKELNLQAFLDMTSLRAKYSGLYTCEVKTNEKGYMMAFHHDLGKKWSIFLKSIVGRFVRDVMGTQTVADLTDSSVVIRFPIPSKEQGNQGNHSVTHAQPK